MNITLEWWHLLIILPVLTISIIVILLVVGKITNGVIPLPWFGNLKRKESSCADCNNGKNIITLFSMLSALTIKSHDVMSRGLIGAQMHHVEEYILTIKDRALSAAAKYIEQIIRDDSHVLAINHRDYLLFKLVIQELSFKIKDILRASCLNNGFTHMNQDRFKDYIEKQTDRLSTMVKSYIRQYYFGKVMKVEEAFDEDFEEEINAIIETMYYRIKEIAEQKYKEIEDLQLQKKQLIEAELGIEVDLDKYKI